MEDDSVEGIYNTLKDCALISQHSGGIGLSIHDIRPNGSKIVGTNGTSNGIVPMLRVFNDTARYIDQGGGKRNGSFAIYVEPWHGDIFEFLELKKKITEMNWKKREICFMLCGSPICLWKKYRGMKTGVCFHRMIVQDCLTVGATHSMSCILNMKKNNDTSNK